MINHMQNKSFYLHTICVCRAVRYDDIYRMDEIKSLSFHIMFYRLFFGIMFYRLVFLVSQNTLFPVIHFHNLSDCDLYTPPTMGREEETERPARTQPGARLVPKRGTTSLAWSRVFKHCSFKTTDFMPLKLKQQSYMRVPSLSV